MAKKPNLKDILKDNPHIKEKDYLQSQELAENLRKAGLRPRGYNLSLPYGRNKTPISDDNDDPRTINLSALYR